MLKAGLSVLQTTTELLQNGMRLRLATLGSGPPMVMLHGYPENLQIWCRLASLLATEFKVIALDWPGMGYSDAWPGGATPIIMAKRLLAILNKWSVDKSTIIAMDMGGQAALAFAAEYPDRVERLVVMNSLVFGDTKTSWEIRLLRKFRFNRFALQYLPGLIFRRAEATFLRRGIRLDPAMRSDFRTAFFAKDVRRFVSKMCAAYEGTLDQLPELYERIDCPTLVLWAERDKHFPLVQAERLCQSIPDAQLDVVSGGTHWMVLTHAEELARRIRKWCREHPRQIP